MAMANITVKKADGTTDVTYTALTPASGEQPARWTVLTAASQQSLRPVVEVRSRDNGRRDARVVSLLVKYPDVRSINGVDTVVGTIPLEIRGTIPRQVADAVIAEAIAQSANLYKAAAIQDAFKSGYAPQ